MSGFLNIGGDPNDRSYRYKMPKLVAKVEGRGNGIKTRIVNCGEIASSLHRKPAVLTKFFGCELGAQSRWEEKEEASIVNGAFEGSILQDKLIESFLPKFVLCPNCGLPETEMKVRKEFVKFDCAACGYSGDADQGHKLITFIIADDKKAKEAKKKEKKTESKKTGGDGEKTDKADKKEKKEKTEGDKEDKKKSSSKDKDGKKDKDKKKDKKKEKKKEESDEEEWFTDISLEAVEARRIAEMSSMSASGAALVTEKGEGTEDAPSGGADAEAPAEEGSEGDGKSSEGDVADSMSKLDVSDESTALLESLLEKIGESKKAKEILPKAEEWAEGLEDPNKAAVLAVIVNLPANLTKHATIILKSLYDGDVVSDEDIFAWYDAADAENASVAAALPFVEFLRE